MPKALDVLRPSPSSSPVLPLAPSYHFFLAPRALSLGGDKKDAEKGYP